MPEIIPYIPEQITVHLGLPDDDARNVTVSFPEYIKNVASSEIYPTWGDSALRANLLAIISFALNRVYTEHYRSRGYSFDITSSTARDQAFVEGRSFFEPISRLADALFDTYIRRIGFIEPLAAKFCNGTTVTCDGLSQWGSEALSREGKSALEILRTYYGDNIELVNHAPIRGLEESYPGRPLKLGSIGPKVTQVQASLNRIGQSYPAIPKCRADGIFGTETQEAVKAFQEIFNLEPDGIVGRATWYALVRIYVAVVRLAELQSQGQRESRISAYPQSLTLGDRGPLVSNLQYMLEVLGRFIPSLPPISQTGIYDLATKECVRAFQRSANLPTTGVVDPQTWDTLFSQYATVERVVFRKEVLFPHTLFYENTTRLEQSPGRVLEPGSRDGGAE